MDIKTADLKERFEQLDPSELKSRLESGCLTPEAASVARDILVAKGTYFAEPDPGATRQKTAAEYTKDKADAQLIWRGWRVQLTTLAGGCIAWNVGQAIAAQFMGIRLGAIFTLLLFPVGYVLTRTAVRSVVGSATTSQTEKRHFILGALFFSIVLLGLTGAWSMAMLDQAQ